MQVDGDRDGRIARLEWTARQRPADRKTDPGKQFDRLDVNGDGALDQTELDRLLARRFARLDANHDGTLAVEERRAARRRADD